MMNKSGGESVLPPEYGSAVEKEIIETLNGKLTHPWSLEYQRKSMDVPTAGGAMRYTPDILITNAQTGETLAVEVKSSLSLSVANIIKFQDIQSAYEKLGTNFLLVVHDDLPETRGANTRLGEYGIHAVGVNRAVDAASEIEKQLTT